ncbi:MAG: cobalamin B12-binding domain-containing protein [Bacillota bacterium]
MKKNIINLSSLPVIEDETVADYIKNKKYLVKMVNDKLSHRTDIKKLIGGNSLDLMFSNHENHFQFMTNIFKLNQFKLLKKTIPWVYRNYMYKGFSSDYFLVELKNWMIAIDKYLKPDNALIINEIYSWMLENHEQFINLSRKTENNIPSISDKHKKIYKPFLQGLLEGDHYQCLNLSKKNVNSREELKEFFSGVIKPSMYEIGLLWERNELSVAEEHLASSIVSRVISALYSRLITLENKRGKAVITSTVNEYHELGSRIIADSLELEGWDVDHLGANTPIEDLIYILKKKKPLVLGLSVIMFFNLEKVIETIQEIRSVPELKEMKILVGGKVFNDNPELYKITGADYMAENCQQAVKICEKWWKERE